MPLQLTHNSFIQSIRGTILAAGTVPRRWRSALLGAAEPPVRWAARNRAHRDILVAGGTRAWARGFYRCCGCLWRSRSHLLSCREGPYHRDLPGSWRGAGGYSLRANAHSNGRLGDCSVRMGQSGSGYSSVFIPLSDHSASLRLLEGPGNKHFNLDVRVGGDTVRRQSLPARRESRRLERSVAAHRGVLYPTDVGALPVRAILDAARLVDFTRIACRLASQLRCNTWYWIEAPSSE